MGQRVDATMIGCDHDQRVRPQCANSLTHHGEAGIHTLSGARISPLVVGNQKPSVGACKRADNIHRPNPLGIPRQRTIAAAWIAAAPHHLAETPLPPRHPFTPPRPAFPATCTPAPPSP